MEIEGEERIEAPRDAVWMALNDPAVLKACIPGCEELEKRDETTFAASIRVGIGPIRATFKGAVRLSDIDPKAGYTLAGEGHGGAAGLAKGAAKVRLSDDGSDATRLTYEVDAEVGGKLAQIGSRLVDATTRRYAREFFAAFRDIVEGTAPHPGAAPEMAVASPPPATPAFPPDSTAEVRHLRRLNWALLAVNALLGVLLFLRG